MDLVFFPPHSSHVTRHFPSHFLLALSSAG
jgi:hypothetical protein